MIEGLDCRRMFCWARATSKDLLQEGTELADEMAEEESKERKVEGIWGLGPRFRFSRNTPAQISSCRS